MGGYKRVRFIAEADSGAIEITFRGQGDSHGRVGVMGLEIYPHQAAPIRFDHATRALVAAPPFVGLLQPALSAFNAHDYEGARAEFDQIDSPFLQAFGYAWIVGWMKGLEADVEDKLLSTTRSLLESLNAPNDIAVAGLLAEVRDFESALFFNRARGYSPDLVPGSLDSLIINLSAATQLFEQIDDDLLRTSETHRPESPLFPKARFLTARSLYSRNTTPDDASTPFNSYWLDIFALEFDPNLDLFPKAANVEVFTFMATHYGGDGGLMGHWTGVTDVPSFDPATTWWADHTELTDDPAAPDWANLQRSYRHAYRRAAEWWMENRLIGDELGGGGGDDVEGAGLLSLPTIIQPDPENIVEEGVEVVLGGVLFGDEVDQEQGYFIQCGDVEHAAEYTTNPLLAMMAVNYGDPRYVEFCLRSLRNMDETADSEPWTLPTVPGQRQFRVFHFGATSVCGAARDIPLNTRPMLPGFRLRDYNNSPRLSEMFEELARAWAEHAMSTAQGKPAGIFPNAVSFSSPPVFGTGGSWWLNGGYYDLPKGVVHHGALYSLLLSAYQSSTAPDRHVLLEPVLTAGFLAGDLLTNNLTGEEPGGALWTANLMKQHIAGALAAAQASILSNPAFLLMPAQISILDAVIARYSRVYTHYLHQDPLATKDKAGIEDTFRDGSTWMSYFFVLGTTSVSYTDRIFVFTGQSHNLLLATSGGGSIGAGGAYPLSWTLLDPAESLPDLGILVHDLQEDSLDILLHNFAPEARDVSLHLWRRLALGTYSVEIGDDADHNDFIDGTAHTSFEFEFNSKGKVLTLPQLPSEVLQKVQLRQLSTLPPDGLLLPRTPPSESRTWWRATRARLR